MQNCISNKMSLSCVRSLPYFVVILTVDTLFLALSAVEVMAFFVASDVAFLKLKIIESGVLIFSSLRSCVNKSQRRCLISCCI